MTRRFPISPDACAHDELDDLAVPGRAIDTNGLVGVPLPDDLVLSTCVACGTWFLDKRTAPQLDAIVRPLVQEATHRRVVTSLDRLAEAGYTQRRLEELLHLSHGYLSKLRNGKAEPSPSLLMQLMQWAIEPARVAEAERLRTYGAETAFQRTPLPTIRYAIPVASPVPMAIPASGETFSMHVVATNAAAGAEAA